MTSQLRSDRTGEYPLECDHCRYPITADPEETDDGIFCSTACREAAEDGSSMPDPGAYKRIVTGVEPLDSLVPDGVPADSFVRLAGEPGTRRGELLTELAWRALERGEPAVVVTATTPPTAVLERFFENGWNVLPALEDDRLRLVDCFTHRLADREGFHESRTEWGAFVGETAAESIVTVSEPGDAKAVMTGLTDALDDLEMTETGLVTIDSLDELTRDLEDRHRQDVVAETRATVCKARYVPIVAATTVDGGRGLEDGAVDGIVELRLDDRGASEVRHRRLAVRKLAGTDHLPQWIAYEYDPVRGLVAYGSPTDAGPSPEERAGPRELRTRR